MTVLENALGYLVYRFFYRIKEFLRHWYPESARIYWGFVFDKLAKIDYRLAWRITLKHFFKPLYGDYSVIGYIMGLFFRSLRLVLATAVYVLIFIVTSFVYLAWLAAPVYLVYRVVVG